MKKMILAIPLCLLLLSVSTDNASCGDYDCFVVYVDPIDHWCLCQYSSAGALTCAQTSPYNCPTSGICPPDGGGGSGCFLAGTKISTRNGVEAIEALDIGDEVLCLGEDGELACNTIIRTYKKILCGYFIINGDLKVTGTHPFRVNGDWKEASMIEIGDILFNVDRSPVAVETIERVLEPVRTFNIEVAEAHTFFAQGILVHNKGPDPGLP